MPSPDSSHNSNEGRRVHGHRQPAGRRNLCVYCTRSFKRAEHLQRHICTRKDFYYPYNVYFTVLYTFIADFLFQTPRISHTSVSAVPLSHAVIYLLDMSGFLMDTTALTKGYTNLPITKTRQVMLLRDRLRRQEV
ncbi:hypothetical protein GGI42DRAFT_330330 [Trichoderma sp. SZMC 28013]